MADMTAVRGGGGKAQAEHQRVSGAARRGVAAMGRKRMEASRQVREKGKGFGTRVPLWAAGKVGDSAAGRQCSRLSRQLGRWA